MNLSGRTTWFGPFCSPGRPAHKRVEICNVSRQCFFFSAPGRFPKMSAAGRFVVCIDWLREATRQGCSSGGILARNNLVEAAGDSHLPGGHDGFPGHDSNPSSNAALEARLRSLGMAGGAGCPQAKPSRTSTIPRNCTPDKQTEVASGKGKKQEGQERVPDDECRSLRPVCVREVNCVHKNPSSPVNPDKAGET
jgi:hypothetical protein